MLDRYEYKIYEAVLLTAERKEGTVSLLGNPGRGPETGMWEVTVVPSGASCDAEASVVAQRKSSSHSPNHRFVIALHSLEGNLQTGPTVSPLEKRASNLAQQLWQDTFSESGFSTKYADLRRFSPIFRAMAQDFSALGTKWRREVNANSRYLLNERHKVPCVSDLA
jgi:hypothetical protein